MEKQGTANYIWPKEKSFVSYLLKEIRSEKIINLRRYKEYNL